MDSGATDHLTNSKLIISSLNENKKDSFKGANKNSEARLESQGEGLVKIRLENNKTANLEKVVYAKDLSKNILSLKIYLDGKTVDIYDLKNREIILTGLYKEPFWIITLKVENQNSSDEDKIFANITTRKANYDRNNFEKAVEIKTQNKETSTEIDKINTENNVETVETNNENNVLKVNEKTTKLFSCYLRHLRHGHVSPEYIRNLNKIYPEM